MTAAAEVHRLGTALCLVPVAVCAVSALTARVRSRTVRRRVAALLGAERARRAAPVSRARLRGLWTVWAAPAGVLLAAWVVIGGVWGPAAGAVAAVGVWRRQAGPRPQTDVDPEGAERQLPMAADLLAACLAAGAGPVEAAEVVGESLGGPVGEALARSGAELRLGGEPGSAWGRLAGIPGAWALADCLERAARTGAPAAEPVSRIASGLREDRARQAGARAQRAAVLVTAPVGLCFLPAFLAIGVAPVVIGMASGLLSGT